MFQFLPRKPQDEVLIDFENNIEEVIDWQTL
jgi:hypothetical protein